MSATITKMQAAKAAKAKARAARAAKTAEKDPKWDVLHVLGSMAQVQEAQAKRLGAHGECIGVHDRLNSMLMHVLVTKGILTQADFAEAAPRFGLTYKAPEAAPPEADVVPAPAAPAPAEAGDGC